MAELRTDPLTRFLVAACLVMGAVAMLPRAIQRTAPVSIERPLISVSVEGQVVSPGVYQVEFGARVQQVIEAAGGFAPGAARTMVALAAPLTDGQVVQVPGQVSEAGAARVSINSAPAELLETLPGVGPAIAVRIVEHRPYSRVDDLVRVPGIGVRTLERLKPFVGL